MRRGIPRIEANGLLNVMQSLIATTYIPGTTSKAEMISGNLRRKPYGGSVVVKRSREFTPAVMSIGDLYFLLGLRESRSNVVRYRRNPGSGNNGSHLQRMVPPQLRGIRNRASRLLH